MNKILLAIMAASMGTGSAHATVFTYDVSGTYADGSSLSGSFSFDDTLPAFTQFSNINIQSRGNLLDTLGGVGYDGSLILLQFNSSSVTASTSLFFEAVRSNFQLLQVTGTELIPGRSSAFDLVNGATELRTGTITQATAAVPEPATWAAMLMGFGAVGFAMRRRKPDIRIAYTA